MNGRAFSARHPYLHLYPAVYGSIRATLEAEGGMIGNNDLWIGAHARAADLVLLTSSEREFRRIQGLEVQNWAE